MARHDLVAAWFDDGVHFAAPASPWMRGPNENLNGLLRQYLPKGTTLSVHMAEKLPRAGKLMNNRPRKVLGWATPAIVFTEKMSG